MTQPDAIALLRDAEAYLSALHVHVARHDNIGADGVCGGCLLRDRIAAALPQLAAVPSAGQTTDRAALRDHIAETMARADGWEWAAANFSTLSTPAADRYRRCAEAVLAVLPEPADRAAVLRELEQRYREHARNSVHPDFRAAYAAVANDLSRLAAGAQPTTQPETGSCVHCGEPVRCITGTLAKWWVHTPYGNTVCNPEHAGDSPRATPEPAAGAQPTTKPDTTCTCGNAGDAFVPLGHYRDCPDAARARQDGAQP